MKYWTKICAGILAGGLLFSTAAATDLPTPEEAPEQLEITAHFDSLDPDYNVSLFEGRTSVWADGNTKYGQQLTEEAAELYANLEKEFLENTWTIQPMETKNGTRDCAAITPRKFVWNGPLDGASWNTWATNLMNDAEQACSAFVNDHPEYYWIRSAYYIIATGSYGNSIDPASITLIIGFDLEPPFATSTGIAKTKEQIANYQTDVNKVVADILASVANMTTIEKLAYFDNWLAKNNQYNNVAAAVKGYASTTDCTPWNILGALLDDCSPVCESYAKAFKFLCQKIGVDCALVSGRADNDNPPQSATDGEPHMWTAVNLDGRWYFNDPTWDDPLNNPSPYSQRNYFLTRWYNSHLVFSEDGLSAPTLSDEGYFDIHWNKDVTSQAGDYWVAQYDRNGKMLECKECPVIPWAGNQKVLAPEFLNFSPEMALFHVTENWAPVERKITGTFR